MERKMRAWEKAFMEYASGNVDAREDELEDKIKNKTITKEEYKEYEKMMRIEKNYSKVRNVIRYKQDLEELKDKIAEELASRSNSIKDGLKNEMSMEHLEKALIVLKAKQKEISEKLKDKGLSEQERRKLENELSECNREISKNNLMYSEAYAKAKNGSKEPTVKDKLSSMSEVELKTTYRKVCIQISKCNLYGNNLMKGRKFEDVKAMDLNTDWENDDREYKLDLKNLKAKGKETKKIRENKDAVKEEISKSVKGIMGKAKVANQDIGTEEMTEEEEEKALANISEFDQKHPKIAKIKNWFKNKIAKVKEKWESSYEEEEEQEGKPNDGNSKHHDFVKTLQDLEKYEMYDIAEKGIDGLKREKMAKAAEKLLQNQQNAKGEADVQFTKRLEEMSEANNERDDRD